MGFLSKAWSGIKKHVKKVAKVAKDFAKKVVTALPGGEALWKAGTKLGGAVMKGVGKVVGALGPVGMIALSFVVGPAAGALWASFGAGAATMAASANALMSTLGTVGTAVFNGANFVGGTLGALGDAVTKGVSEFVTKGASEGVKAFTGNLSSALSGEAGKATMNKAAETAVTAAADALASTPLSQELGKRLTVSADPFGDAALSGEQFTQSQLEKSIGDVSANPFGDAGMTSEEFTKSQLKKAALEPVTPETIANADLGFEGKSTSKTKIPSLGGGSGGQAVDFTSPSALAGSNPNTRLGAHGLVDTVKAAGGGQLWEQLLSQAKQMNRGSFA